jgi:hypothetical protein
MREINLVYEQSDGAVPLPEQQLQQLCSCCPAVESLSLAACAHQSTTALLPLLQLSALTRLVVLEMGNAAATVVDVSTANRSQALEVVWPPAASRPCSVAPDSLDSP